MAKEGQARESHYNNAEQRKADDELAANPPKITWQKGPGGIWIGTSVDDPPPKRPGRRPRPACACAIYGSPRRRSGPQHDEDCARRQPW